MPNLNLRSWTVPLALLAACLLSFGLLIPWLGFYWDDWPTIWFLHLLGPAGFGEVFAVDRPSLGWLFMLTTRLVGETPMAWQVFALLARWLSCLALWWLLRSVWPQHTRPAAWVALLFAVYPGFRQQFIAVTYSADWLILAGFFLSLGLMVQAVKPDARRSSSRFQSLRPALFLGLSWLLAAYAMFSDEYYFGLELLRPVLLWLALREAGESLFPSLRRTWRRILLAWAPFVILMGAFLVWRLFLYTSPRGQVQVFGDLQTNPLAALFQLGGTVLSDMFETGVVAWLLPLDLRRALDFGRAFALVWAALVALTSGLGLFFLLRLRPVDLSQPAGEEASPRPWGIQAALVGVLALFLGGWPFWVTALPIKLRFPWDRFTLAMMLGACLLVAGLVALLRSRRLQALILALIVGLATGSNFQSALAYRQDWAVQKALFWQLAWRIPGLQPGTTLLTADLPLHYFTDNSLTGPLNWLYAPQATSRRMPYLMYDLEVRLGLGLSALEKDLPISQPYRATYFEGSSSQAVVFYYAPPGCLRVLAPPPGPAWPRQPKLVSQAQALSNLSLIQPQSQPPARPPASIFGPEPAHTWCYFYEKADLAVQQEDWQQAAALGKTAAASGLKPADPGEWLPFIQAYAHTGQWEQAQTLTLQAGGAKPALQTVLCAAWAVLQAGAEGESAGQAAVRQVQAGLPCPPP